MKRAALIITEADVIYWEATVSDEPFEIEGGDREMDPQLLADLRTLITAGERHHGTEIDAKRAAARVRTLLPKEDEDE